MVAAVPLDRSPARAERAAAIRAIFGERAASGFAPVLDVVVERAWQRFVIDPLARAAPEVLASPFAAKLRAGFSTYAGLGLSARACARAPSVFTLTARACRVVPLGERAVRALGVRAMPPVFLRLCRTELARVSAAAALILVLDEILDDTMADLAPAARAEAMARFVIDGVGPDAPLVRAARALLERVGGAGERRARMMRRLADWAEAERDLDEGRRDPVACRAVGIAVSMELLAYALGDVHPDELAWMQSIAALGQMVDDVLDLEKDLAAGRKTAAADGTWSVDTIRTAFAALQREHADVVHALGARGALARVYQETFVDEMRRMASILIENP